ncbi:MAG: hypothetical protein ACLFQI_07640 [Halochromatium sp.]|uniref:hypothetical protein n=1 Tax=Halochromatium sp. TaxID=2049430 RepID=UPI00397D6244
MFDLAPVGFAVFDWRASGLGMGLPISRDLVEGHGGKRWADRGASSGAMFHFVRPLAMTGGD